MTRAAGLALALLFVLALAACGGGGKKAASTTTTTTAATTSTTSTTSTGTGSTGTSSQSLLTTLAALQSCPQLAKLESSLLGAIAGSGGSLQKELAAIKAQAAKTPAAVRPDFETIANALGDATTALKGVNLNKATSATITKLMNRLQSPAVNAAAAHIGAWAKTNCHS